MKKKLGRKKGSPVRSIVANNFGVGLRCCWLLLQPLLCTKNQFASLLEYKHLEEPLVIDEGRLGLESILVAREECED